MEVFSTHVSFYLHGEPSVCASHVLPYSIHRPFTASVLLKWWISIVLWKQTRSLNNIECSSEENPESSKVMEIPSEQLSVVKWTEAELCNTNVMIIRERSKLLSEQTWSFCQVQIYPASSWWCSTTTNYFHCHFSKLWLLFWKAAVHHMTWNDMRSSLRFHVLVSSMFTIQFE